MPPLVLTIEVDDKGTPVLKQFSATAQNVGKMLGTDVSQGAQQASKATDGFTASLVGSLKQGALIGAGFAGFSSVAQVIGDAGRAIVGFQAELANVNTLGIRSADVQRQLRDQVLQLPAALGSATDLAKGLYEVISSGVEPAKAVQFLQTSAELANAGLASLDTTTIALTKTMQAYGIPTEQAGRVSDILFKTVEIGQGNLQQFAGALPQVTQLAAAMGISLDDTATAMATLSQTFRSADTAATGFRSLLAQLTQNSEKFLAVGVNIRQVISEQGLLGVVKTLRDVSQGSSERLKTFVNDIEGLQAALALTGPQFQTFIANQQKFKDASGSVSTALKEQSVTTAAAFKEFTGAVDRSLQVIGPVVTTALTTILKAGTSFVSGFNEQVLLIPKTVEQAKTNLDKLAPGFAATVRELLTAPLPSGASLGQALTQQHEALLRTREATAQANAAQVTFNDLQARAITELTKAFASQDNYKDAIYRQIDATQRGAKAVTEANTALQAFDGALKELKSTQALTTAQTLVYANTVETALRKASDSGLVASKTLKEGISEATTAIYERIGTIPNGLRALEKQLTTTADVFVNTVPRVTRVIKEVDEQGKIFLRTVEQIGPAAAANFNRAGAAVPKVTTIIKELDASGKEVFKTIEVFGPASEAAFKQAATNAEAARRAITGVSDAYDQLSKAQLEADKVLRNDAARTREAVEGIASGFHVATQAVNAYGNAASDASAETQKLIDLQIQSQTTFAKDVPGLLEQLKQARTELNNYLNSPGAGQRGPGETEFQTANYRKIIDQILLNLAGLGVDQFGQPLSKGGAGSGAGPGTEPGKGGATIVIGGGGLGGIRPGAPGSPTFVGFGPGDLGLNPVIPTQPTTLLPGIFTPTPAPTLQPIFQAPGGSSGGGGGGGGGTPAGPTVPAIGAPQQGAQGSGGNQGLNSPTLPGPSLPDLGAGTTRGVNVSINNVQFMGPATRQGAQDFVNELGPALREFIRRGGLVA